MLKLFAGFSLLMLTACATPVGQIPDSDYAWDNQKLPIGYQAAYRNLRDAFQTCGERHGLVSADLYTDINEGRLVVYMPGAVVTSMGSGSVWGKITVRADANPSSSIATIGVQQIYDKTFGVAGKTRARWAQWARGDKTCD